MSTSLAALGERMDPACPQVGLRELAHRHRWPGGAAPPPIVSLKTLAARHDHPETTVHRFLVYNTFLLEGWVLKLCEGRTLRVLIKLADLTGPALVKKLNLTAWEVLDKLGISKDSVLGHFGISADDVAGAFSDVFDDVCGAIAEAASNVPGLGEVVDAACSAGDVLGDMLDRISMESLIKEFDIGLDDVLDWLESIGVDFMPLFEAMCQPVLTILEEVFHFPLPTEIAINPKPELGPRAHEIATLAAQEYDIAALCEVFSHARRQQMEGIAASMGRPLAMAEGPDDSGGAAADGGLAAFTFGGRPIVRQAWTIFDGDARGDYFRDSDAWANKGVLLTVVDLGPGLLEIFSTHLLSGGDLLSLPAWLPVLGLLFQPLSDQERLAIQMRQVDALVSFYKQQHDPKNVAIVVGDFNVAANKPPRYAELEKRMAQIGLRDAWPHYRPGKLAGGLFVNDDTGTDALRGDSHSGRTDAGRSSSTLWEVCPSRDGTFCDDYDEACDKPQVWTDKTDRIDYVFVENPTQQHSYALDVSRIRRRSFERHHSPVEELYLSDHVGLDLTLIASPKFHIPAEP